MADALPGVGAIGRPPGGSTGGSYYITPSPPGPSDQTGQLPGQMNDGLATDLAADLARWSCSPACQSQALIPDAVECTALGEPRNPALLRDSDLGQSSSSPRPPIPQRALTSHSAEDFRPSLCWEQGSGRGAGGGLEQVPWPSRNRVLPGYAPQVAHEWSLPFCEPAIT